MQTVPELSFADYVCGDRRAAEAFSVALLRGLQRYGFIILRDHPIASESIDAAYAVSAQFFSQAQDVKSRYVGGVRGYVPFRTERAKHQVLPDLKEFWQLGPERHTATGQANIWPRFPERFQEICLSLFDALQETGRVILEALTPGLSLPKSFFESLMRERNSVLRLIHYPPIATTVAGSVRSAAHEDINLITLLLAPQGPGLELLDRDGQWLSVETDRRHLIVDSGDMLARITNDVIPATTHRVVNVAVDESRYSLPFFMHPDDDVVLRCLPGCIGTGAKYPDIRSGQFLEQRLREIGLLQPDSPGSAAR